MAQAHPHEFVDIAVGLRFDDQGHLGSVGIGWTWGDLTSTLMPEDFGLDPDGDRQLTENERDQLIARFSHWPEDFAGDLHLTRQGHPVPMGGRLSMQAYDPGCCVAYGLAGAPEILGRDDCVQDIRKADVAAAQRLCDQLPAQLAETEVQDQGRFPEVGGAFAEEVRVTCAARP